MRGADLSLSPVHAAARGRIPDSDRGVAVRFPRFIGMMCDMCAFFGAEPPGA